MQAGKYKDIISLQRKSVTADPIYGTELVTWVDQATRIWAEVQDALPSKAESVTMGLTVAKNQVRIRFHWRADVDPSMRVLVHADADKPDEVMQIVGGPASVGGWKEETEIVCERISS